MASHTPFVGREHERTLLLETFLRAERESSVQLVTVVGEPGIGKSRLVTELRTTLDDRPELITWRHGRCLPYGEGITFWALGEIVKAEAGILESDDSHVASSKLDETVAGLFPDEAERAWFGSRLAPLVGAGGEGAAVGREEAFTAWRRFLEAMAVRRPCVLIVEDLHWADGALLEFLEHLLDWSMPVPLLLLCTARPELFERQSSWGGGKRNATTISLAPLSTEEAGRLLQVLLDRTLLPADTQAVLLERAGGNPLYAEQFARMLSERGGVEDITIPETVQALMAARLDTLRPELKGLLHNAAVVGRVFWSGAVAAVGGRGRDVVRRDLNELTRREFVRPVRVSSIDDEDEFSFWHALVRDVAYQQIPRSPRAEKHVAAAAWVEKTAGERLADHAEILVYHYAQARDLRQAAGDESRDLDEALVRFLLLAGDRAQHLDAAAAEGYYRRALDLSADDERSRANSLAKLAGILADRGNVDESIEAWETAIASLRTFDELAAAANMVRLATTLWGRGDISRSKAMGDEAITILERSPGPELVKAYGSAAFVEALGGRFVEAAPLIDKGLAVAAELGVVDVIALLGARAAVRGYQGDPAALDDCREARDIGLRLGLGRATSVAMNNLADGTGYFVGLRPARELWDEVIEFSQGRGLTTLEMWQRGERLRAFYHLGDWDELRQEAHEVVRWEQGHGGGQLEVFGHIYLTDVLVHRAAIAEATAHVDALMPRARESGDPQVLVPGLAMAALVASATGNERRALEHVVELEKLTRETSGWRAYCLVWPARIAIAAGELELAEAFFEGTEHQAAWNACARLTTRAMLAEAREQPVEAAELYARVAERWDEYGSVVERGYALLGLGRCGDAKALREGQAIFAGLGASPVVAQAA